MVATLLGIGEYIKMLLTKEVIVVLNTSNISYFENLGYLIPKIINKKGKEIIQKNTQINVKTRDLSIGSKSLIDIKCDYCNKIILNQLYSDYRKCLKDEDKYYCKKCANNLFGKSKRNILKLNNSKSFEQWCIDNNRLDVLNRWDYELNDCLPNEICYSSNKKHWFKCPKGLHNSEFKSINNITNQQKGSIECRQCNSFAQWGIDTLGNDFLEKYWDYDKNKISPWIIGKGIDSKNIWIKCQEKVYHGSYKTTCSSFRIHESRCPYCTNRNGKVHKFDSLGILYPEVLDIWSNKNKTSPYEYSPNSNKNVWWKCPDNKHNDFLRSINSSNIRNFRCPKCVRERDESFLEEKVRILINELKYTIRHEYDCNIIPRNPKIIHQGSYMPYDNEIVELKLIIEVNGQQHYDVTKWTKLAAKRNNTTPKYELHMQQVRDRYKRIYAKLKGYEYLEIPYWTDDKKETWKKLINSKINEILHINKIIA